MECVKEVNINEAIIHVLDNNADAPILNEKKLTLNEEVYTFLYKHIQKCLKDEELRYGKFKEERNIIKELSQEYLSGQGNFIEASKEIARQLFILMQSNGNIPSSDIIVVSISTERGNMIGIIKMDYVKNYNHNISFNGEKIDIDIIPEHSGLPSSSQKIQKCAFIKLIDPEHEYDLLVMDKQKKNKEEYGSNYFINKFLGCKVIDNERDMTKNFVRAAEGWTRANLNENADKAEKVRSSIKKKLKQEENLNLYEVSDDIFGEDIEEKESFVDYIAAEGVQDNITLDKDWIEKKFKRIRLKIDKDIDLYINEEAYNDINKFQINRNGDGTINIVLKNIINYIEK